MKKKEYQKPAMRVANTADWYYVGKLTAAASSNATTTLSHGDRHLGHSSHHTQVPLSQ